MYTCDKCSEFCLGTVEKANFPLLLKKFQEILQKYFDSQVLLDKDEYNKMKAEIQILDDLEERAIHLGESMHQNILDRGYNEAINEIYEKRNKE